MTEESLNYNELKRRLKKPADERFISTKTVGGAKIRFVSITDLKDGLDARLAPNHWEAIIKSTTICGDNLLMVVSLIIHAADGAFCQDGTGIESVNLKGYGDTGANAFAQALRRAAESHGFCRELWRDELSDEQIEIQKEASKPDLNTRINNALKAIRGLGGNAESVDLLNMSDAEKKEELEALTDQFKRLKANQK